MKKIYMNSLGRYFEVILELLLYLDIKICIYLLVLNYCKHNYMYTRAF